MTIVKNPISSNLCVIENASIYSLDPWCRTHTRSVSCCMSEMLNRIAALEASLAEAVAERARYGDRVTSRIATLEAALGKIDAIRNSIIGHQSIGWSAHVYPLVAALDEAGFKGEGYEVARVEAETLHQRIEKLEAALRPFADPRAVFGDAQSSLWLEHLEAARAALAQPVGGRL